MKKITILLSIIFALSFIMPVLSIDYLHDAVMTEMSMDCAGESCVPAGSCVAHCITTLLEVNNDTAVLPVLNLLTIIVILISVVFTGYFRNNNKFYIPQFWHPPRYIFGTVQLRE